MTNGLAAWLAAVLLFGGVGCAPQALPTSQERSPITLTIGFGSANGTETDQVVQNITHEVLVLLGNDGRPAPMLAEQWTASDDGLAWRVRIRSGVTFHDGTPLSTDVVRDALAGTLPRLLGSASSDLDSIEVVSPTELVIKLKARIAYLPEALAVSIRAPKSDAGTGPFYRVPEAKSQADAVADVELRANEKYYARRPQIDRIVIERYKTVRAAWADMLRDRADMLYEVGGDAFDLIKPAQNTRLMTFQRPYALVILLNTKKPGLDDPAVRRALNAAIDREEVVAIGMDGLGRPADGPVWPDLWANSAERPRFNYEPSPVRGNGKPIKFTLLYSDPTHERIALVVQRQLQSVGVDVALEETTVAEGQKRASSGNFEAWLADMGLGPAFFRQTLFWQSESPFTGGGYSNKNVDGAFMRIRRARNDEEYKAGVAVFQRAIADDPPAIFLAWSERARAVSTRFEVPTEPGRDILRAGSLALWRPTFTPQLASRN